MNKARALLSPEITQVLLKSFPVARRRSAFWFFRNELKKDLIEKPKVVFSPLQQIQPSSDDGNTPKGNSKNKKPGNGISINRIHQLWRNMDPESKRKYFNMAEFDGLRYKEQKTLWIAQVAGLLQKHKDLDRVIKMAPTHDELQDDFLQSLDKLQMKYEEMIQIESTKEIYKDAIKNVEYMHMDSDDMTKAVPRHHRAVLVKPRRPPTAFVLFLNDNIARYKKIRHETKTKDNCMRLCANEWNNLDPTIKADYDARYRKLKTAYDEAMDQYRDELQSASDNYLQKAYQEKKEFRKSIRKRLRDSSVLPLSIRNAFNFFMMDNKDSKLTHATETWRNLPPEDKLKYLKMTEEDVKRYNREIEVYNAMKKSLNELK